MKPDEVQAVFRRMAAVTADHGRLSIMEVCGTHTVAFFRSGVSSLLPPNIRLVSGPGCPVCVTSQGYIDAACEIASRSEVIICTYGDMMRVPGRRGSLESLRGQGAQVRVVYSARDALSLAQERPDARVVFLSVGFETTTPATAAMLVEAAVSKLTNIFVLTAQKLVVPALKALLSSGPGGIDGFILPGHVSVILGTKAFEAVARDHDMPCVVAGFEPSQLVRGLDEVVRARLEGRFEVANVYRAAVTRDGNPHARDLVEQVFEPADAVWRAMGTIPESGLQLRDAYRRFDAREEFRIEFGPDEEPPGCRCGRVIQGLDDPPQCPLFARTCTPAQPVGPCMVSSEGTCGAWYKYGGYRDREGRSA